ncbi:hypothetical protein ISX56_34835, partial [Serratia ureilytica]|nr:hypothetical protein [Serratia ureilytica]
MRAPSSQAAASRKGKNTGPVLGAIAIVLVIALGAGGYYHTHKQGTYSVIAAMAFSTFMWGAGAPNIFALLAKATSSKVSATAGGIF